MSYIGIYYWEYILSKYFNAPIIEPHIACSQPIKAMQKKCCVVIPKH